MAATDFSDTGIIVRLAAKAQSRSRRLRKDAVTRTVQTMIESSEPF